MDAPVTTWIRPPFTLKVGDVGLPEISSIILTQVTMDIPSTALGALTSASAAVTGLTTTHKIVSVFPSTTVVNKPYMIGNASCAVDGVLTVTATNACSATIDPASDTYTLFAFK